MKVNFDIDILEYDGRLAMVRYPNEIDEKTKKVREERFSPINTIIACLQAYTPLDILVRGELGERLKLEKEFEISTQNLTFIKDAVKAASIESRISPTGQMVNSMITPLVQYRLIKYFNKKLLEREGITENA